MSPCDTPNKLLEKNYGGRQSAKRDFFFFETKTRILSPYGAAEIGSGAIDGVEIRPAVSGAPWTSEAALGYVRAVLIQESKQVHGTKFAFLMLRTITASSTQIQ
jgi:hypothetical protein